MPEARRAKSPPRRPQRHRLAAQDRHPAHALKKSPFRDFSYFTFFIDIDFVRFTVVPRIETPDHSQHDARTPVRKYQQLVRRRIDGQPLDLARAPEIGHHAERNTVACFSRRAGRQYRGCPARPGSASPSSAEMSICPPAIYIPLLPLRHRTQVDFAHTCPSPGRITGQVAPRRPSRPSRPYSGHGLRPAAPSTLTRGRFPVDRPLPRQVAGIVHGDLDILTLPSSESLDAGINLTVPDVDIADMVSGERQLLRTAVRYEATSRPCLSYL